MSLGFKLFIFIWFSPNKRSSGEFENIYKDSHSNYASILSHKIPICQETEFQRKEGEMKQAETFYISQVLRKQKFGSALTIPLG